MIKLRHTIVMLAILFTITSCDNGSKQAEWPKGDNPFFNDYKAPYGIPPFDLIKNEHFMPAFEGGIKNQQQNIELIVAQKSKPTFENTIEALEKSNELLNRVRMVFLCYVSANSSKEIQEINKAISPMLSKNSDDIYMNPQLFARVKEVNDNKDQFKLNDEQNKLLEKTYKLFVRSGINLNAEDQTILREINSKLSKLTVDFGQNLLAENNSFMLVVDKKENLRGLPQSSISAAADGAKSKGLEGKWVFTLHNPSITPFLQYADNRSLREKMLTAYASRGYNGNELDNSSLSIEISELRLQRAKLLGYTNFAAYVLDETMAKTPETVNDFLAELWAPALAVAKNEAKQLQVMMGKGQQLEAWDWQYYAEKIRQQKYNLDAETLRPYFKLDNVRDGIFTLCDKLYGLKFKQLDNVPLYHPEAVAYEVTESNGNLAGVLFMDFHPRESKRGGAWCTSYRKESKENEKRVAPIVSIVCNFTRPSGSTPALLTAEEVETFFHEFGHALHGLLANTQYSSLSGSAVPRDFVELPSQIMENWAFEPEMLALYAKHYETGEIIPAELIQKMNDAAKFNQGFKTVEYLAASILDMNYHTLTNVNGVNVISEEQKLTDIGLIKQIYPRYRTTYFQHIFSGGYSAGYYSYIWAEVLDSDAFVAFKETGDIFNKDVANAFRKNILEVGGTKDAAEMYKAFRGKDADLKHLLEKRGIDKPIADGASN